jgi:hypothetical protein
MLLASEPVGIPGGDERIAGATEGGPPGQVLGQVVRHGDRYCKARLPTWQRKSPQPTTFP